MDKDVREILEILNEFVLRNEKGHMTQKLWGLMGRRVASLIEKDKLKEELRELEKK
jgi:hypothetical protein